METYLETSVKTDKTEKQGIEPIEYYELTTDLAMPEQMDKIWVFCK